MKKLFLIVLVLAVSATATKAQFYIGGSLGFWHEKENTSFGISPEVGYSFNNRWTAGLAIGFDYAVYTPALSNLYRSEVINFYAAPYARFHYFSKDKIKLFLDGVVGISTSTTETNNPSLPIEERKSTDLGFQIVIRPGIAINLTDHFSLMGTFGVLGYRYNYRDSNGWGLNLRNALSLGFYYSF